MARIFDTLLSEPSGFRPSRCAKIFLNSDCSSSCEEIYVIKAISKSHFLGHGQKKITKVKLKCLKFCAHQISSNVVHVVGTVVGIPVCNAIILNNVAFRHVKSLQNDSVIF